MGDAGDFGATFDLNYAGGFIRTAYGQTFTVGTERHGCHLLLVGDAGNFGAAFDLNYASSFIHTTVCG